VTDNVLCRKLDHSTSEHVLAKRAQTSCASDRARGEAARDVEKIRTLASSGEHDPQAQTRTATCTAAPTPLDTTEWFLTL
jgi:hypothetical protein